MVDIVREAPLTPSDGNEVSVVAPAAGVGGYEWSLQIDPAIGRLLRQGLEPAGAGFGAGPRTRFTVSLENDAHGSLRLILKRSWEDEPAKVIEYPIEAPRGKGAAR